MGNIQSAEAPRRHRKLSKPPVSNHLSAAGLPYTATAVTPHHEHFSNSYLVGSLPPAPKKASSTRVASAGLGIAVPVNDHPSPLPSPTCRDARRDSTHLNGVLRSQSVQSEQSPRLPSFANSSRASSMVQDGGHRSLTRSESLPIPGHRGSVSYDARAFEAQQLLNAMQKLPSEPAAITNKFENHSESSQDVTDDTKNGNQSAGTSISRTNSDVSLYMPMRRRSVIRTPGVATRAHHSNHPISAKSSFRNSHPPSPSHTRNNSIESDMVRRMSMPSITPSLQSPKRVTTPTEADYKQLGGIKFGSLRITNGAPMATPVPEDEVKVEGILNSVLPATREGYFDDQANPSILASQGLNQAQTKDPMATGQQVTTAPYSVAERSGDAFKSRTYANDMSGNGNADSFPVAEALNVRDDPNPKPVPKNIQLELENKILKGLTRSNSGFIPSPSSESTRQTATKVDSGYSSNVSLRSLRSAVTDRSTMASDKLDSDLTGTYSPSDSTSTRTSSLAPSQRHGRLPIHLEVPSSTMDDDASTCPTSPASPSTPSFSFTRGGRGRFSSFKSTKSCETRPSQPAQKPTPIPIIVTNERAEEQLPSPPSSASGRGGAKLYRFLSSSRTKSLPKVREVRTTAREVPDSPSDLEGSQSRVTTGTKFAQRPGLRGEPSKDTLNTIMSVGSQDVNNAGGRQQDAMPSGAKQVALRKVSRRQSWRQSISQMFGPRNPTAAPIKTNEGEATQKRPAGATERGTTPANATRNPRAVGSSIPRQSPRQTSTNSSASPTKKNFTKAEPRDRRDKPELAHLRTNVSAPNLSETRRSPLSPYDGDLNSALRARTSPPVSMQTRTTKSSRTKSQGHSRSITPSYPINSSRPVASRRLSLPQDLGRSTLQSRHSAQALLGYSEQRSPSRATASRPAVSPQQVYPVQQPQVLSYSSTGLQQPVPAASQTRQRRRASAPPQGLQSSGVPRSRSTTTLLQQQQQRQYMQQQQQPLQSWTPVEAYSLNQQLQQNYMLQNQGVVYGMPNMMQQYPDIYVTGPGPGYTVHRRASSQGTVYGHSPPFRVLHSYNSPAYRGVPIWG
ncbi:hypothetical protein FDECE_12082 [Fusarium decemcellulare]|nr:hypothetical protein FDECE_12082 [Fusarium decemcellulare]